MALGKAKSLDVPYTRVDGEWKAVNTQAAPVCGRAYKVPISLGSWSGRVDFLVVDMDMEEVVLGLEFLRMMAPVQFDEGMLSITHNGKVFGIPLATSKENRARINSLRAWWMPKVGQQRASMMPREEHQCSRKGAHGRANGTQALKGNKAKGMLKGEQRPSGHDQAQGRGHTRQQKPQEGATRIQQVRKEDAPFRDTIARHHRPNKGANTGGHVRRGCAQPGDTIAAQWGQGEAHTGTQVWRNLCSHATVYRAQGWATKGAMRGAMARKGHATQHKAKGGPNKEHIEAIIAPHGGQGGAQSLRNKGARKRKQRGWARIPRHGGAHPCRDGKDLGGGECHAISISPHTCAPCAGHMGHRGCPKVLVEHLPLK